MAKGLRPKTGIEGRLCAACGKNVSVDDYRFRNSISLHEWYISRLCQECQDKVFGVD